MAYHAPKWYTRFLCRCRQLGAYAVYDRIYDDGERIWWLNSATRTLTDEMKLDGATAIFPLDEAAGETEAKNLLASKWLGAGNYTGDVPVPNATYYEDAVAGHPDTSLSGPTVLDHERTAFTFDHVGSGDQNILGVVNGGVGTEVIPSSAGFTQIVGIPFSLEIWVHISTVGLPTGGYTNDIELINITDGTDSTKTARMGLSKTSLAPFCVVAGNDESARVEVDWSHHHEVTYWHTDRLTSPSWTHLVMTIGEDRRMQLFHDGMKVGNATVPEDCEPPEKSVEIRLNGVPGKQLLGGALAMAGFYPCSLSEDQVRRHYIAASRCLDIGLHKGGRDWPEPTEAPAMEAHYGRPRGTERHIEGYLCTNKAKYSQLADELPRFRGGLKGEASAHTLPAEDNDQWYKFEYQVIDGCDIRREHPGANNPSESGSSPSEPGVSICAMTWNTGTATGSYPVPLCNFIASDRRNSWVDPDYTGTYGTIGDAEEESGFEFFMDGSGEEYYPQLKFGFISTDNPTNEYFTLTGDTAMKSSDPDRHGGGVENGDWKHNGSTFIGAICGGDIKAAIILQQPNRREHITIDAPPLSGDRYGMGNSCHRMLPTPDQRPSVPLRLGGGGIISDVIVTHLAIIPGSMPAAYMKELGRLARGTHAMRTRRPTQHLTRVATLMAPSRLT